MYLLECGFETVSLEDTTKPLVKIIKANQKELGLPTGNKVFEELTVRDSQGVIDPNTTYPTLGETYTLTVEHKAKA